MNRKIRSTVLVAGVLVALGATSITAGAAQAGTPQCQTAKTALLNSQTELSRQKATLASLTTEVSRQRAQRQVQIDAGSISGTSAISRTLNSTVNQQLTIDNSVAAFSAQVNRDKAARDAAC